MILNMTLFVHKKKSAKCRTLLFLPSPLEHHQNACYVRFRFWNDQLIVRSVSWNIFIRRAQSLFAPRSLKRDLRSNHWHGRVKVSLAHLNHRHAEPRPGGGGGGGVTGADDTEPWILPSSPDLCKNYSAIILIVHFVFSFFQDLSRITMPGEY